MNIIRNRMNINKIGYSMIELIIVISILSILAMISLPKYSDFKRQSEINADLATCKIIYDTILVLNAKDIIVSDESIGDMIDRGYPTPQSSDGVSFTYTLSPVVVKSSTPGVQHPKN